MKKFLVSVIIPAFNREKFLNRSISSVQRQTLMADEIIVIDNCSTDNTKTLVEIEFPRVKYVYESQKGVSNARNCGVRLAKNEWVAFLDSDDEWKKNKLEEFFHSINQTNKPPLIWHSNEVWIRNGKHLNQKDRHIKKGGDIFSNCIKMCCISPSASIVHRSIFEKYGYFDEELPVCEDYDFWLRVSSKEKIGFIDKELVVKYGGHDDQLSKKFWGMDRFRIISLINLAKNVSLDENQKKLVRQELISKIKILITGAEKRGNFEIISQYQPILEKWLGVSNSDTSVWVR